MRAILASIIFLAAALSARADGFTLESDCFAGVLVGHIDVTTTATANNYKAVYTFGAGVTTETLSLTSDALNTDLIGTAKIRRLLYRAFPAIQAGGTCSIALVARQGTVNVKIPLASIDIRPAFLALFGVPATARNGALAQQYAQQGFTPAQRLKILQANADAGTSVTALQLRRQTGDTFQ